MIDLHNISVSHRW